MPISKIVIRMLDEYPHSYFYAKNADRFCLTKQMNSLTVTITLLVDNKNETLYVAGLESELIPPEYRSAVALYLTHANFNLKMGCFDFDLDNGIVCFRFAIDAEGGEMSTFMVGYMLELAAVMVDRYHVGIMRILYSNSSFEEAYQSVVSAIPVQYDDSQDETAPKNENDKK